jgi:hypothetical protein
MEELKMTDDNPRHVIKLSNELDDVIEKYLHTTLLDKSHDDWALIVHTALARVLTLNMMTVEKKHQASFSRLVKRMYDRALEHNRQIIAEKQRGLQ